MPLRNKLVQGIVRAREYFPLVFILSAIAVGIFFWEQKGSSRIPTTDSNEVLSQRKNLESYHFEKKPFPNFRDRLEEKDSFNSNADFWCQSEYIDQSESPIFANFNSWIQEFELIYRLDEESTEYRQRIFNFVEKGEKLAKKRAEILGKLIRGDPKKAIELGIEQGTINQLPVRIRDHMESWESQLVDITAIHVCFDSDHPGGFIKRWATFPDGTHKRAWVYGKRRNLPSISGISAWGISLGNDFAISDQAIRVFSNQAGSYSLQIGEKVLSYSHPIQYKFFERQVKESERRAFQNRNSISYPTLAGSDGLEEFYDQKYEVIEDAKTWSEAKKFAEDKNGTLAIINSKQENDMIRLLLNPDQSDNKGFDENGIEVNYAWIGATDYEEENSTIYQSESEQLEFQLFASEGNWKWLDGTDVPDGSTSDYQNWLNQIPPNSSYSEQDYAAMDFSLEDGNWIDLNSSYRLPFVIEKTLVDDFTPVGSKIVGIRKVLVVPARFLDESFNYGSSSTPLVNEFGETIFGNIQQDAYEPVSQANLARAMEEVKEFFLRNSDQTFQLEAVITPTVTIPFEKYQIFAATGAPNLYDTSGQLRVARVDQTLDEIELAASAVQMVSSQDEGWDWNGPAFKGITEVQVQILDHGATFKYPPKITFSGGGEDPNDNYQVRQKFSPAEAEAVLDGEGKLVAINITEPGSYYFSEPNVLVNGENLETSNDYDFNCSVENICLSWVGITSSTEIGSAGVGFIGLPGSHVDASNGNVSSSAIVHELSHNFGLWHANRLESRSERPNSDESRKVDYGNPYSVMGTASISDGGDLTITEKVYMKSLGNFGLSHGVSTGVDLFTALSENSLKNSSFSLPVSSDVHANTFRIYRHDYGTAPLALRTGSFSVFIPESVLSSALLQKDTTYSVSFFGSGEGATGTFIIPSATGSSTNDPNANLSVLTAGLGFTNEPRVLVVDDQNNTLLSLNSSWIREKSGTDYYMPSELRNRDQSSPRGIRGMQVQASQYSPTGKDTSFTLDSYWLSYRRKASEYGLSVINGSLTSGENFLLDMNLMTPGDFSDAFLELGNTFSDYESDIHITPVKQGGISPAEYLDVVVNMGTVETGKSKAPDFTVNVSNNEPSVGEFIQFSVQVADDNLSGYAYSWFTGEVPESNPLFLNKSSILKSFSKSGQYVIRVVVSDMKGGVSSRNVPIQVGDYTKSALSSMSGTVRSSHGFLEGARIALSPATRIDHNVSVTGNMNDRLVTSGTNNPSAFMIDGKKSPTLFLNRGEVHRFYFDSSTDGFPLRFLEHPEYENPRVRLKMLSTPVVDNIGSEYEIPPAVEVIQTSGFDTYIPEPNGMEIVGTYKDYRDGKLDSGADPYPLVTRPFAKSLLFDTKVKEIEVSPSTTDIDGNFVKYGGRGHNRNYPPLVYVNRSSIWEDYSKVENNATAKAYVDGVGTISPVISLSGQFLGPIWETRDESDPIPEVVVWGSGGAEKRPYTAAVDSNESNASVQVYVNTERPFIPYRQIAIANQGKNFEPNATMAVLHYPLDPLAYWTFDCHESLFEDSTAARYQPSPAWNALQKNAAAGIFPYDGKLTDYFSFDDENGTSVYASYGTSISSLPFDVGAAGNSDWGVKGRALYLNGATTFTYPNDLNTSASSLSMWLKPESDFVFTLGGTSLTYSHSNRVITLGDATPIVRTTSTYPWMHIGIVTDSSKSTLFVDGYSSSASTNYGGTLSTTNFKGFLDETHIFSSSLSNAQMKILAGRIFLDLSGNKVHAAPVGSAFPMTSPNGQPSIVSSVPSVSERSDGSIDSRSPPRPLRLGDSWGGEGHGRSLYFDDNQSYLDLSPHAFFFAGENEGSISFWIKTDGTNASGEPVDQNVFTAQCLDDNRSFFRIMVRDIGVLQLHAMNDDIQIAKFYTGKEGKVTNNGWMHVVFVADGSGNSSFWVDGVQASSKFYASEDGSTNGGNNGGARAFFSDIENLDFVAIGAPFFNRDTNKSESFVGGIDDFYIYDRPLNAQEIKYLYDLRYGREQIPRLEAVVDAVGTVKINLEGDGYKETPDIFFSYGTDGNLTTDITNVANYAALQLLEAQAATIPPAGKLYFVQDEAKVYSWHHVRDSLDWRYGGTNNGFMEYQLAFGLPKLDDSPTNSNPNLGSVERIVWTKNLGKVVPVVLPDQRTVFRNYLDYVVRGSGVFEAPSGGYGIPSGLFGYSSPPLLEVENSPGVDPPDDATAHSLFFADLNHSAKIINAGVGLAPRGIERFTIANGGNGYVAGAEIVIQSGASGTGFKGIVDTENNGSMTGVKIYDPGHGYKSTDSFVVSDTGGGISGFTINNAGTGYTDNSSVIVSGSGTQFLGRIQVSNGSVTGVTIIRAGSGYSTSDQVSISDANGNGASLSPVVGGTGAILSPVLTLDGLDDVRISGKGYQPDRYERINNVDQITSYAEYWGKDRLNTINGYDDNYTFDTTVHQGKYSSSAGNRWTPLDGHEKPGSARFRLASSEKENQYEDTQSKSYISSPFSYSYDSTQKNDLIFQDWDHQPSIGEPRDVTMEFNQTISHVTLENAGFGYSMPVEIISYGGYPPKDQLTSWVSSGHLQPWPFSPAKIRVKEVDDKNGSIMEFEVVDEGNGYYRAPNLLISGGGGQGATARVTGTQARFSFYISNTNILLDSTNRNIESLSLVYSPASTYLKLEAPVMETVNGSLRVKQPRSARIDFNGTHTVQDLIDLLNLDPCLSSIRIDSAGQGYEIDDNITISGGNPVVDAQARVSAVDAYGGVSAVTISNPGQGFTSNPSATISDTNGTGCVLSPVITNLFDRRISGSGASIVDNIEDPSTQLLSVSQYPSSIPRVFKITGVRVQQGGLGYFNIDQNNSPKAGFDATLLPGEQNATLSVRLGGYLDEVGRCSACESGDHAKKNLPAQAGKFYHHLDAWVEIWDRNRSEEVIDQNDDRALASAKIRNGVVEKIVVIKSGRGYVDPVAYVRGISPHHNFYMEDNRLDDMRIHRTYGVWGDSSKEKIPSRMVARVWRCVNQRETKVGTLEDCGHIFQGQYPPEECPGEEDKNYPLANETTDEATSKWYIRHLENGNLTHYHNDTLTTDNRFHLCDLYDGQYDNTKHKTAGFRSRRCTGKKENFVLINDFYRTPYEDWQPLDANLSVVVEKGKIKEIVVSNGGSMYISSEVVFDGSGVGVDAIPIYDERGENVRVIYDDPNLKNLETDYQVTINSYLQLKKGQEDRVELDYNVFLPSGAGQGFIERPWSWDWKSSSDSTFGPLEKVLSRTIQSEKVNELYTEKAITWKFGTPSLRTSSGDRILEIAVSDPGVYDSSRSQIFQQSGSYPFSARGRNYAVIKISSTWSDAAQWAVSNGGELISIESEQEQNSVMSALTAANLNPMESVAMDGGGGSFFWVGGNDRSSEGNWIWDGNNDGSGVTFWSGGIGGALVSGAYGNWGGFTRGGVFVAQEPDNSGGVQDALALSLNGWPSGSAGQWNDLNENNQLFFIVEYGTNSIVLPTENSLSTGNVTIDFNSSHLPHLSSSPTFIPAVATAHLSDSLIKIQLDQNATYSYGVAGNSDTNRPRSLFVEEPRVSILPHLPRSGTLQPQLQNSLLEETKSPYVYLNGEIDYDSSSGESYFDLFVDNRIPSKFYYGYGSNSDGLPAMGGEIIVSDGMPGMNWGQNEPLERNMSAYTDQNGYYFIPNLEPGLYNVAVFMEDRKFQELTFRPDSNLSRVSDVLYVPGFSNLSMETDNRGAGRSRLIWSSESRSMSRPHPDSMVAPNPTNEFEYEQKTLEGIGGGFKQGVIPELVFIPNPSNSSGAAPKVKTSVLVDGSLKLTIIDDENTTIFNPGERFTVSYSSNVQGIDFREYFQFSESNESGWQGSADFSSNNSAWLEIFPNDAGGLGILEVPLSTSHTGNNQFQFTARGYDQYGVELNASNMNKVKWNMVLDFNSSQAMSLDSSLTETSALDKVASLGSESGSDTSLTLSSTLRSSGIVNFEILNEGTGYEDEDNVLVTSEGTGFKGTLIVTNGVPTGVRILESGRGYSVNDRVTVTTNAGYGVNLKPVLGGKLFLEAKIDDLNLTARTQVTASTRNELNATETWLDYYFDSIMERNETWWNSDLDGDGLNNLIEYTLGTHPDNNDTDGDQLNDRVEVSDYNTNPHQPDTDEDGLSDFEEATNRDEYIYNQLDPLTSIDFPDGTDPRMPDTDRDGILDGDEVEIYEKDKRTGLSPVIKNTQGVTLGGYVYNLNNYSGNLHLKMELITSQEYGSFYEVDQSAKTSWPLQTGLMPMLFTYRNLPPDKYYRVTAFIDSLGNGKYDKGEPVAYWEGLLSRNNYSANLFLVEPPPEIKFADPSGDAQFTLTDADSTFPLTVIASDLIDGTWGLDSVNPFIQYEGNLSEYFTPDLTKMEGSVDQSIPLGSYSLFYQAIDKSGNKSEKLEQVVIIDDQKGPVITLKLGSPVRWPLGSSPWIDPGYLVTDNRDPSVKVFVYGTVDPTEIGDYTLLYTATDSAGNSAKSVERIVQVRDSDAPVITFSEVSPKVLTRGHPFILPSYSAVDLQDGDVTGKVSVTGFDKVDVQVAGDYSVVFSAVDNSGNQAQETFVVRVEPPAYALSGKAIDGYLVGAKVIFDSDGDGVSDIIAENFTDENGAYSISITNAEFSLFDKNKNNILDPEEGRIVVSNGVDSSTGAPFNGSFFADANSTVVTPLTSLVSGLISQGLTKQESLEKLAQVMNLSASLDLTSYDPLVQASAGDMNSKNVLIEGARISNLLKQTEAFVALKMGANYPLGQASALMVESISKSLSQSTPVHPLSDSTALSSALSKVFDSTVGAYQYSTDDLAACSQMIEASDSLHLTLYSLELEPLALAGEITKQQLAVEQNILDSYEELSIGAGTLQSIAASITTASLSQSSSGFETVNLFAPDADDFSYTFRNLTIQPNTVLHTLNASDFDGDKITASIQSGNVDSDGDGKNFLSLSSDISLLVADPEEIKNLYGQALSVVISLDDGRGKTGLTRATLKVDNELVFESSSSTVEAWMSSAWFGDFHATGSRWIYHSQFGWLYVHSDEVGGYWFWDPKMYEWWWTNQSSFPYVYEQGGRTWLYFQVVSDQTSVYDFNQEIWSIRE